MHLIMMSEVGDERHSHEEDVQENGLHSIISDIAAEALVLDDARVDGKEDNQTAHAKKSQSYQAGSEHKSPTKNIKQNQPR